MASYFKKLPRNIKRGLLGALVLMVCASIYSMNKWRETPYFGEVISISEQDISINDPKKGGVIVIKREHVSTNRKVSNTSDVLVGEYALVFTKKNAAGEPVATLIREVEAPANTAGARKR